MKTILKELNDRISSRGCLVVARDGMLIAADVQEGVDLDRLSALGASIVTEVGECLTRTGMQGFSHLEIAAEHGKLILTEAGPTYLLVLLGARLEIGPGSIEITSAAQRLAREAALHSTNQ